MENTNNLDTNIPQPTESPIIFPTPKKINIFKYLFFISVAALLTVIISFYFILKNKNSKVNQIQSNNNIVQQIPDNNTVKSITETPTNTQEKTISYQAKSVEDDTNSVSKLVLTDQNNNQIVIKETPYSEMAGHTLKPEYRDFVFSSDYNFLYYMYGSGWEFSTSFLYDIKNKKNIDLGLPAETFGFTPDSKYFYACAEAGMMAGGAIVKQLPQLNNVFSQQEDQSSFNCQYDQNNNEVIFYGLKYGEKEVISQYNFSVKLGTFSKIK
ncbi:MAG: hypothetical protein PHS06_04590 [Candidatus Shapirobacteria bacterium]|nr:hypothetical protein [Candidatus Shapirobacteria bacterium]